ncbi:MAG: hypothetical protein VKK62_03145 [Synechococcaceae cyanobacterium]|nr:hypothetical protein [Synechococcaceae cyanobacterium]
MPPRNSSRPLSRRFLSPAEEPARRGATQAWSNSELFSDGQWQAIRVVLEAQGWNPYQIELVHDQLRQGWPLAMAKRNVATLTGQCPLRSHRDS